MHVIHKSLLKLTRLSMTTDEPQVKDINLVNNTLNINNKVLCIYHANCADGFAAAWVVRKFYAEQAPDTEVEFFPGVYQNPPPPNLEQYLAVIMVDFSYKRPVVLEMCKTAKNILIIDHHASAINDLAGIDLPMGQYPAMPNITTFFDIMHSGAMLCWKYYYEQQEPPQLFKHIEDRDLWKFRLEGTREIQANLFSYPYDFELWDKFMAMDKDMLYAFKMQGEALERKHFKDIKEFLAVSTRDMTIGGKVIPVVNCPYMWGSDAAHILAETVELKCAGYYYDTPNGRIFGLRSIGDMDCSKLAIQYGGGGHKNAAGFKLTPHQAMKMERDSIGLWGISAINFNAV
jgi:uncharacterized protein